MYPDKKSTFFRQTSYTRYAKLEVGHTLKIYIQNTINDQSVVDQFQGWRHFKKSKNACVVSIVKYSLEDSHVFESGVSHKIKQPPMKASKSDYFISKQYTQFVTIYANIDLRELHVTYRNKQPSI